MEYKPKYSHAFSLTYGLFVHWGGPADGGSGGLVHPDGTTIGDDLEAYAETFDTEKIAEEFSLLGFDFVVMTSFHGYGTMLHPCKASDSHRGEGYCTKERNVLGSLISALKKRGIATIIFTHPLDGHDYSKESRERLGWYDPTDNYKRWNDFLNDVYGEIVDMFGNDIMGIGFDSEFGFSNNAEWKGKLNQYRLRRTILTKAPHLQLYALAGPNWCCEFGFKEAWRPSWLDPWQSRGDDDFDADDFPAYRRVVALVQASHWATIKGADQGIAHLTARQLYRYSVLQAASSTEGPGVAWGASPYSDGSWENNIREVFAQCAAWRAPIKEALSHVYPSTSYPTPEGAKIAELPYGIVATKAIDNSVEYIHVLNPPTDGSKQLKLPKASDGKIFIDAKLLQSGNLVSLSVTGEDIEVLLELGESDEWDTNNTCIALTVDPSSIPPRNLALYKQVIYSSAEQVDTKEWPPRSDYGSIRLTNGICTVTERTHKWGTGSFGWRCIPIKDVTVTPNQWVGVDLGRLCLINRVVLYSRDDIGHEGEEFPICFQVETCHDEKLRLASEWNEVAAPGMEHFGLGVKIPREIRFEPILARFVRVVGKKIRVSVEDEFYRMHIVEMEVYGEQQI